MAIFAPSFLMPLFPMQLTHAYHLGEQLEYGEDICGLVLSIRPKSDTINIS
jgi:hypothetical protein